MKHVSKLIPVTNFDVINAFGKLLMSFDEKYFSNVSDPLHCQIRYNSFKERRKEMELPQAFGWKKNKHKQIEKKTRPIDYFRSIEQH